MNTITPIPCKTVLVAAAAIACALSGCASWSNPVANGIPARLVPQELLAESKEHHERIALSLLRQKPPEIYLLAPGDILGVYIDGVTGAEGELPPVNFPQDVEIAPSSGYPLPVRDDGTLPLPLVDPVRVEGMSLTEAQNAIIDAYTNQSKVLLPGEAAIMVTLIRPRHTRVLVIREDSPTGSTATRTRSRGFGSTQIINTSRKGTGAVVELPAYQNDVLTALARTGGLPGTDATDEVIIQRGYAPGANDTDRQMLEMMAQEFTSSASRDPYRIRIPLRTPRGQRPSFTADDIILHEGDIVYVEARDNEFFYTGGLLPSDQVPLPRDYDLRVVEAIALVGGPLLNAGINSNNLQGTIVKPGMGNPSPSLVTILRRAPNGGQVTIRVDLNHALRDPRENLLVQANDVLLLQETPGESFARYIKDVFRFNFISDVISRSDTTGATQLVLPE